MKLSRITTDGRFVPEIDGLRFIAITSVVLYHLQTHILTKGVVAVQGYQALFHGFRGVQLFFVISGFILALPFARSAFLHTPTVNLQRHFLRRLTRLEPPYIINLIVCFAFGALWLISKHKSPWQLLPNLFASIFYLHNLIFNAKSAINPAAWSLEIEIQFYCLVPALASVFLISRKSYRRGVIAVAILLSLAWQRWLPVFPETILGQIQFFLIGFALADIYLLDWKEKPSSDHRWDIVSLVCWPFVFLFDSTVGQWALPFVILILYCAAFRGVLFRSFFRNRTVTTIGGMCYSIYLFHQLVILNVGHLVDHIHIGHSPSLYYMTESILILPCVLLVSTLYFVAVERPCMDPRWPSKLWKRLHWQGQASARPRAAEGQAFPVAVNPE